MSNKKFKVFCHIFDYVESADPELAELLKGTCADMSLRSTKGKGGLTLLIPEDKGYRKEISDFAYSDKPEEANKATDMLNALIFRDVFKTPSDWIAKKDDIPNGLIPSQHVEIDSATATEIVFKNGARATPDKGFKDSSKKQILAVWRLTSGKMPVTTDKPAKLKYMKSGKEIGSYELTTTMAQSSRHQIAIEVENEYFLNQVQVRKGGQYRNVYLEYIASFLHHVIQKDMNLMYEKILPLISLDKLDFYVLIEPHKFGGNYLISDVIINNWWSSREMCDVLSMIQTVQKLLNSSPSDSLIYKDRAGLLNRIHSTRKLAFETRPRSIIDPIEAVYKQLEDNNTIDGAGPVYPDALYQYYKSEPGLKLIHDELRYTSFLRFKALEQSAIFDHGALDKLLNDIGECLYASTEGERATSKLLLNKKVLKYLISPNDVVTEIGMFVNSTMFLYVPMTFDESCSLKQKNQIGRPEPGKVTLYNVAREIYTHHSRIKPAADSLVAQLRLLDVSSMDPALRDELKRKFA